MVGFAVSRWELRLLPEAVAAKGHRLSHEGVAAF
jgi:hypothetical protein